MAEQHQTGTREWAAANLNIQLGCEHDCRYCYARYNAVHRFHRCSREQWSQPMIDGNKVDKNYGKSDGIVMFPSTHDITPSNLAACLAVLGKLLEAGNQVLIVSKPHLACIVRICEDYRAYRDQITFRFTIGSTIPDVLAFWDPGAPDFKERLACLQHAHFRCYNTSVSCEPFLDNMVQFTYIRTAPYITDSFWIGKLRNFDQRIEFDRISAKNMAMFVEPLRALQADDKVRALYELLDGNPFIKWKDSIREVIER